MEKLTGRWCPCVSLTVEWRIFSNSSNLLELYLRLDVFYFFDLGLVLVVKWAYLNSNRTNLVPLILQPFNSKSSGWSYQIIPIPALQMLHWNFFTFQLWEDGWEDGIWSCDLRANERPQKKWHGKGTNTHRDGRTSRLLDQSGPRADSVKKSCGRIFFRRWQNP